MKHVVAIAILAAAMASFQASAQTEQSSGRSDPVPTGTGSSAQSPGVPSGVDQSSGRGDPSVSGNGPNDQPAGAPEVQQQDGRSGVKPEGR